MGDKQFEQAAETAKKFSKRPSDDQLLKLYSLFKQATVGDINTDRPGMLDFKGKAKWDAWQGQKGMTQEQAQKDYIALVDELKGTCQ